MKTPNYTFNQKVSIITLLLTTASALTLLTFNLRNPSGSNTDEMIFLGTITIMFITLISL